MIQDATYENFTQYIEFYSVISKSIKQNLLSFRSKIILSKIESDKFLYNKQKLNIKENKYEWIFTVLFRNALAKYCAPSSPN